VAILAFPAQRKASADVLDVELDWSPFLPALVSGISVSSHSVSTEDGDVVAADVGMSGLVQTVRLSSGAENSFTTVIGRVVLSNGVDKSRAFTVSVA
jgi:hypothetical protein